MSGRSPAGFQRWKRDLRTVAEVCTPLRFLLRLPQLCGVHCPVSNPLLCSFLLDQALTLIRGCEEAGRESETVLLVGGCGLTQWLSQAAHPGNYKTSSIF